MKAGGQEIQGGEAGRKHRGGGQPVESGKKGIRSIGDEGPSRCKGQRKNSSLLREDFGELKWCRKEGGWQYSQKSFRSQ